MAKKHASSKNPGVHLKKLIFLIGKWHTQGEILPGASVSPKEIRGMDIYEWVAGGFFITFVRILNRSGKILLTKDDFQNLATDYDFQNIIIQ